MAFAACARDRQYSRPSLVADNILDIRGGRHPLAEMVVDTFIPNDTVIRSKLDDGIAQGGARSTSRVQVITGIIASQCEEISVPVVGDKN